MFLVTGVERRTVTTLYSTFLVEKLQDKFTRIGATPPILDEFCSNMACRLQLIISYRAVYRMSPWAAWGCLRGDGGVGTPLTTTILTKSSTALTGCVRSSSYFYAAF